MVIPTYAAACELARRADALQGPSPVTPRLFAFTDPDRTPDLHALARALPPGSGLVLRTFGRADLQAAAFPLSKIAQTRALVLLVAAEPQLALQCGAAGVHWPEARIREAAHWRRRFAVMSASAHNPSAARRAARLCELVFVSPAFASASPSAGRPLGPLRMAAYARRTRAPVYALGGITGRTAPRLNGLGIAGFAAIDGLSRA